jgi:hypothetical protein
MAFFGTLCSPFEMEEWQAATGIRPDFPMIFEHWDQQRPLDYVLAKAKALGFTRLMLTWEPWTPPATGIGNTAQGALQPQWSNEAIAAGQHDAYIRMISKNIRESGLEVWIRWGHEMNGDWHPWRTTPDTYIAAFKRIVSTFRGGGTTNAKFIWSPNSNLWQEPINFLRGVLPYWPGKYYVDYVGMTAINFGGDKEHPVSDFADRFSKLVFNKPLVASEVNTAWSTRETFFRGLNAWVGQDNILSGLVLSQPPVSRGQQNLVTAENMQWNITEDDAARSAIEQLIAGLHDSELR